MATVPSTSNGSNGALAAGAAPAPGSVVGGDVTGVGVVGAGTQQQRNVASFMVCGTRFDVDSRYSLIKPIGQGAYGVVWYGGAPPGPRARAPVPHPGDVSVKRTRARVPY